MAAKQYQINIDNTAGALTAVVFRDGTDAVIGGGAAVTGAGADDLTDTTREIGQILERVARVIKNDRVANPDT